MGRCEYAGVCMGTVWVCIVCMHMHGYARKGMGKGMYGYVCVVRVLMSVWYECMDVRVHL